MSVVAFDTLKFAQTLRDKAKMSPEQAEGIASAFAEATGDQLATKDDIAEVRGDIARLQVSTKEEFARVQASTKEEFARQRATTKDDIAKLQEDISQLQVSTKEDIAKLQVSTKEEIAKLQVSTKEDMAKLQVSNKDEIARAQVTSKSDLASEVSRLEIKIESVKSEIIRWQFGTIGFQTLLMLGAVIALARLTH